MKGKDEVFVGRTPNVDRSKFSHDTQNILPGSNHEVDSLSSMHSLPCMILTHPFSLLNRLFPAAYVSSTHFSVGKKEGNSEEGDTTYYVVDHSRNGTYMIRADATDSTPTAIGKGQVALHAGDKIVLMFKSESKCEYIFETIAEEEAVPSIKSPPLVGAASSSSSGSSSSTTDNVVKLYQSENQSLQEENKQLKDRLDEEKEKYRVLEKDHKTAITDKTKLEKEVAAKEQDIKDLNSNNSAITARCQVISLDLSSYQPPPPPLGIIFTHLITCHLAPYL